MPRKLKKEKSPPEPFWNELVSIYFNFCREKFNEEPSFDGSSPRDLKLIIKSLRERAEKSNIEWTLDTSKNRLHNFLSFAYQDIWLRNNFLLSNINRQKDKIFFNIRAAINKQTANPFD
jgi:hypothetical protein